jgi:phosphoadenosine phosphosulfate reductase
MESDFVSITSEYFLGLGLGTFINLHQCQIVKNCVIWPYNVSAAQRNFMPNPQQKLEEYNQLLQGKSAKEILAWATTEFQNLYQTTSFGLTGLVILDLLQEKLPVIYIDTLYNFPETYELVDVVTQKYGLSIHKYYPEGCSTREDFERLYGEELWIKDGDRYDYLVKAEPGHRANVTLHVEAVLTGRRRSQGNDRAALPIVELDESVSPPIFKINPLYDWTYDQCWNYVQDNHVPYNKLHDRGYKSIGDYHSTEPTRAGEGERDGRWRGQEKTECGLHKDYLKMKIAAKKAEREALARKKAEEDRIASASA